MKKFEKIFFLIPTSGALIDTFLAVTGINSYAIFSFTTLIISAIWINRLKTY